MIRTPSTNLHIPDTPPRRRGNLSNCLRYFPTQAMNFAFKEKYQKIFVRPREEVGFALWFAGFLAAGGAAGATALTVSYPLEFTYTRLAADTGVAGHGGAHAHAAGGAPAATRQYAGIADCIRQTVKADGIRGIYRGYGPSVAGIIVYRAGAPGHH
jgi:solute carrier family 25 (adenine nucleotide translocator) protein 4/5/6/31